MNRDSNIELIRIIAILFVIAHHLLVHGMGIWRNVSLDNFFLISVDSFFFIGVNLFVLISGYCRVKLRFKKLFYIWVLCALVGGFSYAIHLLVDDATIGRSLVYNTIFAISNAPGTWYIQVYVFLMLLSPLINTALDNLTKQQMRCLIFYLTLISVYFGWLWSNEVNVDGYNLINFIWLYVIGFYMHKFCHIKWFNRHYYLLVVLLCAILNSFFYIFFSNNYKAWTYNNPLIVISSIAFFLYMMSFQFEQYFINKLAKSTLVVYLVHENCYISYWLYGSKFSSFYSINVGAFLLSVLLVYCLCVLIDMFVRIVVANNILKYIYPFVRNSCMRLWTFFDGL